MSHWAELDEDNIVIRVLVGDNNEEDEGEAMMNSLGGTWLKTSYNTVHGVHLLGGTPFRKNYAGIGYSYNAERDAFIPPKPFASWVLDEEICDWVAPVAKPTDGPLYRWDESTTSWYEVQ